MDVESCGLWEKLFLCSKFSTVNNRANLQAQKPLVTEFSILFLNFFKRDLHSNKKKKIKHVVTIFAMLCSIFV